MSTLKGQYLQPENTVYAQHRLATRKQRPGESSAEFVRALQRLMWTCGCQGLTAEQHVELLLSTLRIPPPPLFTNLTPDCKPVATKSRRYSAGDRAFIKSEVQRLLREGVIEASGEKNRMVVDYSQTINRFMQLDAYPLPCIVDMFKRVPFGVTNGVSVFQREMDRMVDQCQLKAMLLYLDNITICRHDQQDHDNNLQKFLQAAKAFNLTYNKDKYVFGTTHLAILGCVMENGP
ncbi:uncharacterized protein LOC134337687 [Mobula hypostoma]|uniref:uncharacterized protein LOC134337687 n=1 Tax=Mobula hypostoma TaxID=723540 RepID=UPI002FC3D6C7